MEPGMEPGQTEFGGTAAPTAGSGIPAQLKDKAKTKAYEEFDGRKEELLTLLDKVATSLDGTGRLGGMASGYARRATEYLRDKSPDELLANVRSAVRRRPEAMVIGFLLGGFVLGRILRS